MSTRATASLAVLLVLLITLPYAFAAIQGGNDAVFGGFLLNPRDGNSYLAKMLEGWNGSWKFTLPYTAEPGAGVVLFTFYLSLGHLARWIGLPLVWMFHLARVAAAVGLVFALRSFFTRLFPDLPQPQRWALLLAVFGSGLGWIAALSGAIPSDLWVAEGYPFLSSYANPHFPLGLILMVLMFSYLLDLDEARLFRLLGMFGLGLILAIVLPFGYVVAAIVSLVAAAWQWVEQHRLRLIPQVAAFGGGGLLLVYQYAGIMSHPVLSVWNAQNITPSPPVWDALLSFSPALAAGLAAIPILVRRPTSPALKLLITWFLVQLVLIYLPFSLQRRFMVGYFIPCAAMAGWAVNIVRQNRTGLRWLPAVLLIISLPTNLLVLATGFFGAVSQEPLLYLSRDEADALAWIDQNTPSDSLVLAGEEMGMYIPARTGRRVIYGHPFETTHSQAELETIKRFYEGKFHPQETAAFLVDRRIDYIFIGPRESNYGTLDLPKNLWLAYESGRVKVFRVEGGG